MAELGRFALALVVTLLLLGFVLKEHGETVGVEWQERLGDAMEITGILACVSFGLIALWVWAL
jgi:hypothetical protein